MRHGKLQGCRGVSQPGSAKGAGPVLESVDSLWVRRDIRVSFVGAFQHQRLAVYCLEGSNHGSLGRVSLIPPIPQPMKGFPRWLGWERRLVAAVVGVGDSGSLYLSNQPRIEQKINASWLHACYELLEIRQFRGFRMCTTSRGSRISALRCLEEKEWGAVFVGEGRLGGCCSPLAWCCCGYWSSPKSLCRQEISGLLHESVAVPFEGTVNLEERNQKIFANWPGSRGHFGST